MRKPAAAPLDGVLAVVPPNIDVPPDGSPPPKIDGTAVSFGLPNKVVGWEELPV